MKNDIVSFLAFLGVFGFGWETRKMLETTKKVKTEICADKTIVKKSSKE